MWIGLGNFNIDEQADLLCHFFSNNRISVLTNNATSLTDGYVQDFDVPDCAAFQSFLT